MKRRDQWKLIASISLTSLFATLLAFGLTLSTPRLYITNYQGAVEVQFITAADKHFRNRSATYHKKSHLSSQFKLADSLEQEQRKRQLKEACRELNTTDWSTKQLLRAAEESGTLYVNDRLRYLYCLVPKVACTSWTRVLIVANGKVKGSPNNIAQEDARRLRLGGRILKPLTRFSEKQARYRLQNYFKFLFVRHPLERLYSAFKDRLKSDHRMPKRLYSKSIIRRYRDRQKTDMEKGVQFKEFVRYIVDPANRPSQFNFHWRPQTDLCLPCHIDYNFIGHYETLHSDAQLVIDRIGAGSRVQFPNSDPDNRRRYNATLRLQLAYNDVRQSDVQKLKTVVYANDFSVFGFQ